MKERQCLLLISCVIISRFKFRYCIGGTIDGKDIVDINHCYNPASDSWKELNKMMLPRTGYFLLF